MLRIVIVMSIVFSRIVAASPNTDGVEYIYGGGPGAQNSASCPLGFGKISALKDCMTAAIALRADRVNQDHDCTDTACVCYCSNFSPGDTEFTFGAGPGYIGAGPGFTTTPIGGGPGYIGAGPGYMPICLLTGFTTTPRMSATTTMTSSSFLSATAATVDAGTENSIGMLVGIVAGIVAMLTSVGMCYNVFRRRRSQEATHVAAGVGAAVAKTEPAGHPPRGDGARRANQKLSEEEQDVQQNCSTKLKFFSTLRFEEAKPRAKAMKAALEEYENVECYLCSVGNGHNIQQDIWANYDEAQCAIVYGTTTYGMKTTEVAISTFDEMNMIMEDKKPFFLLKLCDKFELAPTRASFPKTVAYEDCQGWIDGPPPETVVAEVLRCGAAAAGVPVPVLKMDSLRSTASLAESLGPDNLDTFV